MSMLQTCTAPGCSVLTIGRLCVWHEPVVPQRTYPRGRPYPQTKRPLPPLLSLELRREELVADVVIMEGAA
jgi:hypothetical protein